MPHSLEHLDAELVNTKNQFNATQNDMDELFSSFSTFHKLTRPFNNALEALEERHALTLEESPHECIQRLEDVSKDAARLRDKIQCLLPQALQPVKDNQEISNAMAHYA